MSGRKSANQIGARLVRAPVESVRPLHWDENARRVLAAPRGFLRVLGGPGTGKTTLLAATVARRIAEGGIEPERLLVLTTSRRSADALRRDIARMLTTDPDQSGPVPRTSRL